MPLTFSFILMQFIAYKLSGIIDSYSVDNEILCYGTYNHRNQPLNHAYCINHNVLHRVKYCQSLRQIVLMSHKDPASCINVYMSGRKYFTTFQEHN